INAAAVALAVATLAYPVTLALRLTQSGAEISGRSSEFIFVPVAYVLALGIVEYRLPWKLNRLKPLLFLPWAAALLVGGVVVGWPPWARMPGPYLVVADSRSIEMRGLDTAEWARTYLGQGNRVATDRTNALLMGGYGEQRVVTHLQDGVDVSVVFLSRRLGAGEIAALRDGRIRYLVVDKRLSTGVPAGGPYFEVDIPRTRPISPTVLAKFDHLPRVSRIYDSGNIVVYDVGALSNAS
ncbi:MAG: rane protein, partial [Chloroflexi bacterium]|nr:rane protein [Chloroflexota bacterium]